MSPRALSVPTFLAALAHPQTDLIHRVRQTVAEAAPELVEGIKWNAPSYALEGNDIVTFNFRQFGGVALIFHTGPKGKDTQTGAHPFDEAWSEIRWLADKRFAVAFPDEGFLESNKDQLTTLVQRWVALARNGFL